MADMLFTDINPLFNLKSLCILSVKQNLPAIIVTIPYNIAAKGAFPFSRVCLNKI